MYREAEVIEAIRCDDLASLLATRYEKALDRLPIDDFPSIFYDCPSPIQVAAFYGATKCFNFLLSHSDISYLDRLQRHLVHFSAAGGNVGIFQQIINNSKLISLCDGDGSTPLIYAAKYGRKSIAQMILLENGDPNIPNKGGFTAAHLAAASGSVGILDLLFQNGASLKQFNDVGWTPLHYAIKYHQQAAIDYLIQRDAIIFTKYDSFASLMKTAISYSNDEMVCTLFNAGYSLTKEDHNCWTCIHFAVSSGNLKLLQTIDPSAEILQLTDRLGRSLSHIATINCHLEVLKWLNLSNYDMRDAKGRTPLSYAAELGYLEISNFLLQRSADQFIPDKNGNTPLHYASLNGHMKILNLLEVHNIVNKQGKSSLHLAFESRQLTVASFLINGGASLEIYPNKRTLSMVALIKQDIDLFNLTVGFIDIKKVDSRGWSVSHFASQYGMVKALDVITSIDPANFTSSVTNQGQIPIHIAAIWNQIEVIKYAFLFNNINWNAIDNMGNTALHLAIKHNHVEIVKILLQSNKVNVNAQNFYGETPLHLAIEGWSSEIIYSLLKVDGIDINKQENRGISPLMLASKYGQAETVEILSKIEGVDSTLVNKSGFTAAHYAARLLTTGCLKILADREMVDWNAKTTVDQRTPLDIATRYQNEQMISLITMYTNKAE